MKVDVSVGGVEVVLVGGVVVGLVDVDASTDVTSSPESSAPGQPALNSTTAVTTATRPDTIWSFEGRPGLEVVLFDVMPTP
ncbi:hypothetical protein [Intrasporangium sp.]|uniref:hypothetical protein n=1 Tax=Intrasporangium sp. TaxID=1925024 RepID=UPI00293A1012|nr:hypothetical protein [Intrasporangium sp.]MDV3222446.1 hypothetical protein [Intrasporangium sp.]